MLLWILRGEVVGGGGVGGTVQMLVKSRGVLCVLVYAGGYERYGSVCAAVRGRYVLL